jgi:hypothetical protein
MIISVDAENVFDKIQHPFMIKALMKLEIEGMYHNIIKVIHDKPIANILPNGEELKPSPLKSERRQDVHSFHSYSTFNMALAFLDRAIR